MPEVQRTETHLSKFLYHLISPTTIKFFDGKTGGGHGEIDPSIMADAFNCRISSIFPSYNNLCNYHTIITIASCGEVVLVERKQPVVILNPDVLVSMGVQ